MRTANPKSVGDVRTAFDASTGPTSGSAPVCRLDDRDAVEPRATMAQPASVVNVEPVAFVQRIDDNLLHWSSRWTPPLFPARGARTALSSRGRTASAACGTTLRTGNRWTMRGSRCSAGIAKRRRRTPAHRA